ncbi:MAG TPA: hypothetical protein PK867_17840, partial [Pirellulales bacterium]|nr:hypothetical protein [Pirellulales bacterium]
MRTGPSKFFRNQRSQPPCSHRSRAWTSACPAATTCAIAAPAAATAQRWLRLADFASSASVFRRSSAICVQAQGLADERPRGSPHGTGAPRAAGLATALWPRAAELATALWQHAAELAASG